MPYAPGRNPRHRPRGYASTRKWRFVARKLKGWHNAWRRQTPQERVEARIVARYTTLARKLRVRLSALERRLSNTYARDRPLPRGFANEYIYERWLDEGMRPWARQEIRGLQRRHTEAMREVRLAKRGRVHYARYH